MSDTDPFIIAIETSGRMGSVAAAVGGKLIIEKQFSHTMKHAVELMPTIDAVCRETGHVSADVAQIYVSTGPGSFTGLRIAIAIARAMSQANGCRLVAVPTTDVLAKNAPPDVEALAVVLDAKRGQVFGAYYWRESGQLKRKGGPALMDPADLVQQAASGGKRVALLGEGVPYHREVLAAAGITYEIEESLWRARAGAVHEIGWLMAQRGEFINISDLLPVYIRLAEAEEVWRKKHNVPL